MITINYYDKYQAKPKSKFILAELAVKLDSNQLHNNNNWGSIKQAECHPPELFKGSYA